MSTIEQERKVDLICTFLFPAGLFLFFILSRLGYAVGSHGDTYIAATHIVMALLVAVVPAIRYTRILVFPYPFVAIVTIDLYAYCVPLFLGFYDNIWWWDEFAHWMSSMLVAMIVFMALCLIQTYGGRTYIPVSVMCFLTFIGGFALGNLWELIEGTIDWLFGGNYMQHWMADTLEDIHMDFIGCLSMALLAWYLLHRKTPSEIVQDMDERHVIYNRTHRV